MEKQPLPLLVAEDNPALAQVVRFHLEREGFQVTVARNGRDAWTLLQTRPFVLLVTDHQMPGMSGCELCENIRRTPPLADLKVIMLTAKGLELDRRRLREELGVAAVLPKPFSVRELAETVVQCLGTLTAEKLPPAV